MKYFFTVFYLVAALSGNAQVVNIPDSNFKNALVLSGVDMNGDGEIQVTEAEAVINLTLASNARIRDFTGIKFFVNMQEFEPPYQPDQDADSVTLDISGLTNLEIIRPDYIGISSLLANGCIRLKSIIAMNNPLSTVDLTGCVSLEHLDLSNGRGGLSFLNLSDCRKLNYVNLGYTPVTNLDLSHCDSLSQIVVPGHIQTLNIGNSKIKTVRAGWISGSFNISGCKDLEDIYITSAGFTHELDFSECINLRNLTLGGSLVPAINLKNGSWLNSFVLDNQYDSVNGPLVVNICADDFEVNSLRNLLADISYTAPNVSSYCSFYPAGNYNTIKGKIKLDLTSNGCDPADRAMANVPVKFTDIYGVSFIRYTLSSGDFTSYVNKGNFSITPYFPYPWFLVDPISAVASFDTTNSLINTTNFCISPNGTHNDLEITFLPAGPARPGFDAGYILVYENRGTTTLSGIVQLTFDNSKINFVAASMPVSSQSTGQVSWNYNNLQPFESRTIDVTFNLLPPPINNIDDTLTYLAVITPSVSDETPFDNSFLVSQRVTGSWDPNDKQCLEGNKLDISKIGEYLHYPIRFQNEGTDTAFNIVVADTLSDNYDWSSFELISSSHPVSVNQKNGKLEFIFENIKLPYKAINEPASNGYVAFKIKPKPSVVIGDSLNNTAAIYFDFNTPVITNRATTVVTNSSVPVPVKVEYFSVNSSGNRNVLNWKAACSNGSAKFNIERSDDAIHFNSIGNITATALGCQLPFNFSDDSPVAGKNYYRLKITDADGISFYSKTLTTGNSKAGLEITAIANDNVYLSNNKQQTITIKVIAADGKEILNETKKAMTGNNSINLHLKNAASGIYTVVVYTTEGKTITKRFIR